VKVLHIYKDYHPVLGGIENHIRLVAEEQARRGLDVTVLATALTMRTEDYILNGVHIIKAGRLTTVASAPISFSLFAWAHRLKVHIAHLHFPYPIGELAHLLLGHSKHTIITYHSDIVRQRGLLLLYRPFLWRILHKADRIIATNAAYVQTSPFLRRFAHKITVIPLGIPIDRFTHVSAEAVAAIRQRYADRLLHPMPGGRGEAPLLLSVGRLRYYKGLDYLIRAMPQIPAVLLIIGTGPMEKAWRSLAQETGVADRVLFLGDVSDEELPAYYHAADLYVSPASHRSEAYGISILEALACGIPAVSTELGTGTSFVNLDGITGLVVPPRDQHALAAAINRLLADAHLRRRLGEAGRLRVHREFSAQTMVERIIQVYNEVAAARPAILLDSRPGKKV